MTEHAPIIVLVYHRAYNTYCINNWYKVLRYGHRLQQQQYKYIHAVIHKAFYLLHFRRYYCCYKHLLLLLLLLWLLLLLFSH